MPPKATNKTNQNEADILQKLEAILDTKFELFGERIERMEKNLEQSVAELKVSIQSVDAKAQKALELSEVHEVTIQTNVAAIDSLNEHVNILKEKLKELYDETDELKNRSLRKTLIFINIQKEEEGEKSWNEVKHHLATQLGGFMDVNVDEITKQIERAHRGKPNKNTDISKPLPIFAKFHDWEFAENVKSSIIHANQSKNTSILVSQMFSDKLTERRNQAIKERRDLRKKDPNIKAYIKYPADLMMKTNDKDKYSLYYSY